MWRPRLARHRSTDHIFLTANEEAEASRQPLTWEERRGNRARQGAFRIEGDEENAGVLPTATAVHFAMPASFLILSGLYGVSAYAPNFGGSILGYYPQGSWASQGSGAPLVSTEDPIKAQKQMIAAARAKERRRRLAEKKKAQEKAEILKNGRVKGLIKNI